jgi:nitrogen fixation/metabolism regulation signal transduction histidine kinase
MLTSPDKLSDPCLHPISICRMRVWIKTRLNRQLIVVQSASLIFASLLSLVIFSFYYHAQLTEERTATTVAVNRLLQTALENAMLKQDLEGLRHIVQGLGQQPNVQQVIIANPKGEIRFASNPARLGEQITWTSTQPYTEFIYHSEPAIEVLRSVNPVANRAACVQCHGQPDQHPINGVLIVDYETAPIRAKALKTAGYLLLLGIIIILLTLATVWVNIQRLVLIPVKRLSAAGEKLTAGDLTVRVNVDSENELGRLARIFNHTASQLQQQMAQLHAQKTDLQALIDAIPDGIRVIGQDYRLHAVNHAYCQQVGLTQEQALSQPCYAVYQRDTPCIPTLTTCPLDALRDCDQPLKKLTHYLLDKPVAVETTAAPLIWCHHGHSERLIVESIRDLERAVLYSHEQKLAAMGQVAAGIAHEIHNPLGSVRLAVQNTLRRLEHGQYEPEQISHYLRLVDKEVEHCIEVTHRLLKLTTLGSGQRTLVDIDQTIEEVLSLLEYEGHARGIQITFIPCGQRVFAQEHDMRMLVLNLIQNAFHAMPQGGTLRIFSELQEEHVAVIFEDSGEGIAPEHLGQIFDPFFSYRAGGKKGTGLGLSICKALVDQYQGQLHVNSRPHEGTCFRFILPLAKVSNTP